MADLGTLNSVESTHVAQVISVSNDGIVSYFFNSTVACQPMIGEYHEDITVIDGDPDTVLVFSPKSQYFENVATSIHPITVVVPGPIANIQSGIQIGYNRFKNSVPRVYPPIFIQARGNDS